MFGRNACASALGKGEPAQGAAGPIGTAALWAGTLELEARHADETQTYVLSVNKFSDLILEKFRALQIRGLIADIKFGLSKVGVHEYNGHWLAMVALAARTSKTHYHAQIFAWSWLAET